MLPSDATAMRDFMRANPPREVTSPMPLGKARDLMQSLMARGCSYAFALSCAQNETKEEARGG